MNDKSWESADHLRVKLCWWFRDNACLSRPQNTESVAMTTVVDWCIISDQYS